MYVYVPNSRKACDLDDLSTVRKRVQMVYSGDLAKTPSLAGPM